MDQTVIENNCWSPVMVAGGDGSITDPMVSFAGQWVYYTHIYNLQKASQWNPTKQGADIFKIHFKTRKVVWLTNQRFSPNTGAADWSSDFRTPEQGKTHIDYGVYNIGPRPQPNQLVWLSQNPTQSTGTSRQTENPLRPTDERQWPVCV
ncbi:MAG: hypothetical protein ABGZ35_11700 [Planctomycetaceae bacterium]